MAWYRCTSPVLFCGHHRSAPLLERKKTTVATLNKKALHIGIKRLWVSAMINSIYAQLDLDDRDIPIRGQLSGHYTSLIMCYYYLFCHIMNPALPLATTGSRPCWPIWDQDATRLSTLLRLLASTSVKKPSRQTPLPGDMISVAFVVSQCAVNYCCGSVQTQKWVNSTHD